MGSAIVEKGVRALTDSEIEDRTKIYSEEDCGGMKNIIKFIQNLIWVFGEHEPVSAHNFYEITKKHLEWYVTIQADDLLNIYTEVALNRTRTYSSF